MKTITFVLLGFLMITCTTPRKELAKSGLFDKHECKTITQLKSNSEQVNGNLLFGARSSKSEPVIEFSWERNFNEVIFTYLQKSKCKFLVNNIEIATTVEFIFEEKWSNDFLRGGSYENQSEKINLNDLISKHLKYALIKISKSDFEKLFASQK